MKKKCLISLLITAFAGFWPTFVVAEDIEKSANRIEFVIESESVLTANLMELSFYYERKGKDINQLITDTRNHQTMFNNLALNCGVAENNISSNQFLEIYCSSNKEYTVINRVFVLVDSEQYLSRLVNQLAALNVPYVLTDIDYRFDNMDDCHRVLMEKNALKLDAYIKDYNTIYKYQLVPSVVIEQLYVDNNLIETASSKSSFSYNPAVAKKTPSVKVKLQMKIIATFR